MTNIDPIPVRRKTLIISSLPYDHDEGKSVPWIRLSGKWLNRFGFHRGDKIEVITTQSSITIIRKEQ